MTPPKSDSELVKEVIEAFNVTTDGGYEKDLQFLQEHFESLLASVRAEAQSEYEKKLDKIYSDDPCPKCGESIAVSDCLFCVIKKLQAENSRLMAEVERLTKEVMTLSPDEKYLGLMNENASLKSRLEKEEGVVEALRKIADSVFLTDCQNFAREALSAWEKEKGV